MKLDIIVNIMTQIPFIWLCNHIQNRFECNRRENTRVPPATRDIVLQTSLHFYVVKYSGI